jgi:hypothetical protein
VVVPLSAVTIALGDVCVSLLKGRFGAEDCGFGFCDFSLLLRRIQLGKHLALLDHVSMIGIELRNGRAHLETDLGQHAGFNGTKAEHTDWHACLNAGNLDRNRPSQCGGIRSRNCCYRQQSNCNDPYPPVRLGKETLPDTERRALSGIGLGCWC